MLYLLVTNFNNRLFKHAIISISLKEILVSNTFNVPDSLYYSQSISNQINRRRKPNFKCFTIELVFDQYHEVGLISLTEAINFHKSYNFVLGCLEKINFNCLCFWQLIQNPNGDIHKSFVA